VGTRKRGVTGTNRPEGGWNGTSLGRHRGDPDGCWLEKPNSLCTAMSDNTGVFDLVQQLPCSDVVHTQLGCVHSVSHLIRHNLKYVLGIYVPLSLGFLVRSTKDLTPELLLHAVKSGIRSGLWLSTSFQTHWKLFFGTSVDPSNLLAFLRFHRSLTSYLDPGIQCANVCLLQPISVALQTRDFRGWLHFRICRDGSTACPTSEAASEYLHVEFCHRNCLQALGLCRSREDDSEGRMLGVCGCLFHPLLHPPTSQGARPVPPTEAY